MLFQLSLPPPLTSVLKCIITLAFNILKNHKVLRLFLLLIIP